MSHIDEVIWQKAEELANRNYTTVITSDKLTDGSLVYLAKCPELPGCMTQSPDKNNIEQELVLARTNWIYFHLIDGLPVPEPEGDDADEMIEIIMVNYMTNGCF